MFPRKKDLFHVAAFKAVASPLRLPKVENGTTARLDGVFSLSNLGEEMRPSLFLIL